MGLSKGTPVELIKLDDRKLAHLKNRWRIGIQGTIITTRKHSMDPELMCLVKFKGIAHAMGVARSQLEIIH